MRFRYASIGDRRARNEGKRGVTRMEVSEVADLVDEHRAILAAHLLAGAEHEVVQEQLTAPLEEVGQTQLAAWAVKRVGLLDPYPRQATPLGGECIECTGCRLFLHAQLLERALPLLLRDDDWLIDGPLLASAAPKGRGFGHALLIPPVCP
jgi:hypothetical protein